MDHVRTVTSFATEELGESNASLEDAQFQWIVTELRREHDTVR